MAVRELTPKWGDFEPRVGLAYDPFGDGKTSIRGGAGIAYDFFNMEMYQNADNITPCGRNHG